MLKVNDYSALSEVLSAHLDAWQEKTVGARPSSTASEFTSTMVGADRLHVVQRARHAGHRRGAQHGMPQTKRFSLTDVDAIDILGNHGAHELKQLGLAACFEFAFKLVGLVEMILDRALGAACDENHVGNAGGHRLFHSVLDQRFINDRQHFLRTGLGSWQKARPHASNRKYRFADFFHYSTPFSSNFNNPASSITDTPSSKAFSSLEPASSPATT